MFLEVLILILLLIGTYTDIKSFYVSNWITHPIILLSLPLISLSNTYRIPDTSIIINNTLIYPVVISLCIITLYFIGQKFTIPTILSADVKVLTTMVFIFNPIELVFFFFFMTTSGILMIIYNSLKTKSNPSRIKLAGFVPITIAYFIVKFIIY